jgi:hypothetical protein
MGLNPDVVILQPFTKDQVNYRHRESCGTCGYFNGRNKCSQVQGNISPDMICIKWVVQETNSHMTGKEVIMKEYEKSKVK